VQEHVTAAMADTLHRIDFRAHLEMLSRTEPKTFMQYVALCMPKGPRAEGTKVQVNNFHSALPRSPLDDAPPGFDAHK
jgi:hypothetical protein